MINENDISIKINTNADAKLTIEKSSKKCVHKVAEYGATSLPNEHRDLIDVLLGRPTVDGKYEVDVPSELIRLEIDKSDLDIILKLFAESKSKLTTKSAVESSVNKRNTEWINIFEKYVSKANDTCVFMYKGHHFSTSKTHKTTKDKQFLMSADAKCKFISCTCSFHAIVYGNGELTIAFTGRICHSPSEQRARPIRGNNRQLIAERLTTGSTPDQLRLEKLGHLTETNLTFGKLNAVGSSPHVYRKIRSEATTSLMLDRDLSTSLEKIKEQQASAINPGPVVPGYLQTITISPLRLVFFTKAALTIWKQVADRVPMSWDATGGIVVNRGKRVFYYELTVASMSTRSITTKDSSAPSLPVTCMLSNSHKTLDLVQWLQDFEKGYRTYYGYKASFPKPPIIHSDGALVFQLAALRFFNNDMTMADYVKRCWNIVNRAAGKEDLQKTVVHSCLAHFMKNLRHQALKYYPKKKVNN